MLDNTVLSYTMTFSFTCNLSVYISQAIVGDLHSWNWGMKSVFWLTCWAHVVSVLIFSTEDGLLYHAQEYDSCNPELDPQQVFPVAGCPDEPQQSVQDVHHTHHHVELKETHTKSGKDIITEFCPSGTDWTVVGLNMLFNCSFIIEYNTFNK